MVIKWWQISTIARGALVERARIGRGLLREEERSETNGYARLSPLALTERERERERVSAPKGANLIEGKSLCIAMFFDTNGTHCLRPNVTSIDKIIDFFFSQ